MRALTLSAVLGGVLVTACLVDRPSETLVCATAADCAGFTDNRVCTGGFCVVSNCPGDCTSCNEALSTCQIDCTSANDCAGTVTCPAGWDCTISCVGDGACNDVICAAETECTISCVGAGACGDVDCSNACRCDLDCMGGACASMACPERGGGNNAVTCTVDSTAATECDSTRDSRCAGC
jgi:hypothetical protein